MALKESIRRSDKILDKPNMFSQIFSRDSMRAWLPGQWSPGSMGDVSALLGDLVQLSLGARRIEVVPDPALSNINVQILHKDCFEPPRVSRRLQLLRR